MTREVDAYGARAAVRRPLGIVGLNLITLGVYGVIWYHRVNVELRAYGRAYHDSELCGSNPRNSVLALVPGALLVVPPIVSAFGFAGRLRRAERYGQTEMTSGWLIGAMILTVIFIPAIPGYVQSTLNQLWRRYPSPGAAAAAAEEAPPAALDEPSDEELASAPPPLAAGAAG